MRGFVNLRRVWSGHDHFGRMGGCNTQFGSGEGRRAGHYVPNLESLAAELSVISGREQMASGRKCEATLPCTSTNRWAAERT
jgi:hypothetical protein